MEIEKITEIEAYEILSNDLTKPDGNYMATILRSQIPYLCIRIRKGVITKNRWRVLEFAENWMKK